VVDAVQFPGADWAEAPLDADVNASVVEQELAYLMSGDAAVGTTLGLVAIHRGRVVTEAYVSGENRDSTFISWSMAKSVTHALVGFAVADGKLRVDDNNLFPEWVGDDRRSITLQHLLNMRSGLKWVEDYVDDTTSDVIEMLFGSGDQDHAAYALNKPLEAAPGTLYKYSSGTTNIVARVLANALGEAAGSNEKVLDLLQNRLFAPIGMTSAQPKFDPAGTFVGSSYVFATARDFARFGYLYLNGGVWNGTRLLPEGWVQHGASPVSHDPDNDFFYGGHWWIRPEFPGSMTALGYEGQFTWVVPSRDLVLVRLGKTPAEMNPNVRHSLMRMIDAFPESGRESDKTRGGMAHNNSNGAHG
jgi:CubicO group peptidase (beta-lactamase class C family)